MNPFQNQYHLTYQFRLTYLKPQLIQNSINSFKITPLENIYEVNNFKEETVIIGILYIDSELKPSLFNSIKKTNTYNSKNNKLFLEDGSRIEIKFDSLNNQILCTGMVVAFKGVCKGNIFYATDFLFAEENEPVTKIYKNEIFETNFTKICFISCIKLKESKNYEKLILFLKYLKEKNIPVCLIGPFFPSDFDLCTFKEILSINKVYLVPGKNDPTSKILPQKPIHSKLCTPNTVSLSNPVFLKSNNKTFLITDGSNVEDVLKYYDTDKIEVEKEEKIELKEVSEEETENNNFSNEDKERNKKIKSIDNTSLFLDCMEILYKSKHFCPTAPDTLHSEPILDYDPFIIYDKIDLFVCGNAPCSKIKKSKNLNFISVSKFCEKSECLIYDLMKEEIEIIKFSE